jgi:putative ABC transport system permease protein
VADTEGTGRLRSVLVVTQFAVSIALIICTSVIYAQTVYARTADPGFKREGLIQISRIGGKQAQSVIEPLMREIERIDGVRALGRSNIGVDTGSTSSFLVRSPKTREPATIGTYSVDTKFFETMGIPLLAGRNFSETNAMDDATLPPTEDLRAEAALAERGLNVVINQAAAERLGFRSPSEAIGQQFKTSFVSEEVGLVPITVIGVVGDARFRSARDPVEPIMYDFSRTGHQWMIVRYDTHSPNEVRSRIQAVWKRLVSEGAFEADFADDIVRDLYAAEEARAQAFAASALLAIIVACLGLFGLAAFTAERRTKEIGIRKVLGARVADILKLLTWQFTKPVVVANLIAWPLAWWTMRDWLNTFDDRVDLGPGPFIIAGALALAIAIGTISGHALRVARANPINALRYE